MIVADGLRGSVTRYPHKTAYIHGEYQLTFDQLNKRVNRLSNTFLAMGLQKGEKLAFLLNNCTQLCEILWACAKMGIVAVPLNFRFRSAEIDYVTNDSDSVALIYGEEFLPLIDPIRSSLKNIAADRYIVVGSSGPDSVYEDLLATSSEAEPVVEVSEEDPWYIGYTSGTTGFPKGAIRSNSCNAALAINWSLELGLTDDDILMLIMPFFHSNSIWGLTQGIFIGNTVVIYPFQSFDVEKVLEIFEKEKVTYSSLVPTMYTMILNHTNKDKYTLNSIKTLISSSAPLLTKTKEAILEFFKGARLYEGYGSTEAGAVTILKPRDQLRKIRCCGYLSIGQQVKILDENGNEVPVGVVGELYSKGPTLFEGYYKNPEATITAFRGNFFSAGDMARMDAEGYYYLVDRKKDMIISGGENVYPTEVEEVLVKHPSVLEVAVIGVPDEKWGEAVKAVITLQPGMTATIEELIAFTKEHLAGYKCPKSVDFVVSLPKNATGKIMRKDVRAPFWEGAEVRI
ncbi:MAG: class I adenylate-forming enzyme family protein [Bacillota bacterium]